MAPKAVKSVTHMWTSSWGKDATCQQRDRTPSLGSPGVQHLPVLTASRCAAPAVGTCHFHIWGA